MCNICRVAKRRSDRRRRIDEESEQRSARILSLWRAFSKGRSTGAFSPSRRAFLHSHPSRRAHATRRPKRKGKVPIGETETGENPRPFTGSAGGGGGVVSWPPWRAALSTYSHPRLASSLRLALFLSCRISLSLSLFLCSDSVRYLATFLPTLGCTLRATPPIEMENGSVDLARLFSGSEESGNHCLRITLGMRFY